MPPVRRGPPPSQRPASRPATPRLALMRANREWLAPRGEAAVNWLGSAMLYLGVALAGAVWIGGSLFDLREGAAGLLDRTAVAAGFKADVATPELEGQRRAAVVQAVLGGAHESMVFASPQEARRRLLDLGWIQDATVTRLWPSRIVVKVKRQPMDLVASYGAPLGATP